VTHVTEKHEQSGEGEDRFNARRLKNFQPSPAFPCAAFARQSLRVNEPFDAILQQQPRYDLRRMPNLRGLTNRDRQIGRSQRDERALIVLLDVKPVAVLPLVDPPSKSFVRRWDVLSVTFLPLRQALCKSAQGKLTAGDEARTRDVHLGKVVLYQLSYTRSFERDNNVQPTAPRNLLIASECSKSLNPNRTFTASYDQTLYE
jgi:hypothetical protein